MIRIAATLTLAAAALAGCGASSGISGGDQTQIRSTIASYFQAIGSGDGATACALMTPAAQHKAAGDAATLHVGSTCTDGLAEVARRIKAVGGTATIAATRVTAIKSTSSGHARVTLRTGGGNSGFAYMRKLGTRWLLANGATE